MYITHYLSISYENSISSVYKVLISINHRIGGIA